jgi:hypothetical protein
MLRTSDRTDRAETTPMSQEHPEPKADRTPARLLAQRGLFFGPSGLVPEDLYSVVERGGARRERDRVTLAPGTRVSTNTYFGRFHATYWQRWTDVGEIEVSAVASGTGRIRLMASDTNKVWRIVAARDLQDADATAVRLVGPIDRFVDGGGMYLEIIEALHLDRHLEGLVRVHFLVALVRLGADAERLDDMQREGHERDRRHDHGQPPAKRAVRLRDPDRSPGLLADRDVAPAIADIEGRSLLPVVYGERAGHRAVSVSGLGEWRSVFDGRFKMVRNAPGVDGDLLFDLLRDPQAVCDRLADFLGLPRWQVGSVVHEGARAYAPIPESAQNWLADQFAEPNERLFDYLGMRWDWIRT